MDDPNAYLEVGLGTEEALGAHPLPVGAAAAAPPAPPAPPADAGPLQALSADEGGDRSPGCVAAPATRDGVGSGGLRFASAEDLAAFRGGLDDAGATTDATPAAGGLLVTRVGRGALRDPPEGTLCCLLARGTHAPMAASKAKAEHYDVLPTPHRLADGALTHLPAECLFVVKRKGPAVGLSSLAAEVRG